MGIMTRLTRFVILAILLASVIGCDREITIDGSAGEAKYVGSQTCGVCHEDTYASFKNTGHPYKLNEADDARQASHYPYTTIASPPPGVSWSQVDKVIGGFWWKARFIDHDGYIITGDDVQYNFANDTWTAYHSGETVPYDCGPCHMTGYQDFGNQENKAGLVGTWAFNGIQCEECHGRGSNHVAAPREVDMKIDRSAEQCGKCHIRGDIGEIPASGGFTKHHEQWNEMYQTKHITLECVDCHDPHIGLHPDNTERADAIKINCETCHFKEAQSFANSTIDDHMEAGGPNCIDCHMPYSSKSAVGDLSTFTGDVRSHLWRINIDGTANMWNGDSTLSNGYLTVDYACLHCHTDRDKTWAAGNANRIHPQ